MCIHGSLTCFKLIMKSNYPLYHHVEKAAEVLSKEFFSRFCLCPLTGTEEDLKVYDALEADKVPVVISDTFSLPLSNEIDLGTILFRIGTCPSELSLLQSIERISSDKYEAMREAGKKAVDMLKDSPVWRAAPVHPDFCFPAITTDGRLLREQERFRFSWRKLKGRVLFFGGGKFLQRLLDATNGGRGGPEIIGIADDATKEPSTKYGYPLKHGSCFRPDEFDAVYLATDSMEDRFAERAREFYGADVELLYPSVLMIAEHLIHEDEEPEIPRLIPPPVAEHPQKLEGITVCSGYADFLSWTLPENAKHFDRFVVVTSPEDSETQKIAEQCGAEVVISKRFRENGASFNKGKMLNDGLKQLDMKSWIVITDADILFRPDFRQRIFSRFLNRENLYYATRFNTPPINRETWLTEWFSKPEMFRNLEFSDPGSNQMPWGYFQLFYRKTQPNYSEDFDTAGDVDYEFQSRWPKDNQVLLPEAVIHISHGNLGSNWQGRSSIPMRMRSTDK